MPLSAVNMFPGGPVKSADALEYFNLLTGAMTDQPVTLANTLTAGGSHGVGTVPFRVNGVAAQTANMQEIRALGTDVNPIFAIGPAGQVRWGPGGGTATDVTLARSGAAALQITGTFSTTGVAGIGVAPTNNFGLKVAGVLTGLSGAAAGIQFAGTAQGGAAGDSVVGLSINGTLSPNGFANVTCAGINVGPAWGNALLNIGVDIAAPTTGATNLGLRVAGGVRFTSPGAFAAGDKYVVVDATGNVHISAIGPAS